MCWPVVAAVVGAATGLAGTGMSVAGAVGQGKATSAAAYTNATMADIAAMTSEWEADHIRHDTRFEAAKVGRETKLSEGTSRAAAASTGFDVASQDLVRHFESILEVGDAEQSQILRRGYLEADSRRRAGIMGKWQAGNFRDAGRRATTVAGISAAGQAFSGVGGTTINLLNNWEGLSADWANWRNG
jgi:hypothetical protein